MWSQELPGACRVVQGISVRIFKALRCDSKNNGNIPTSMTDNEFTKAEKFNSFFASVGQSTHEETQNTLASENRNINFPPTRIVKTEPFLPQAVDVSTVVLTIKRLQATESFGSDLMSLRFLKDSLCITAHYLTAIINTSIVTAIFPESWKHAIVVPVLKDRDAADVSNFRLISLLPILSKALEKVVSTQLVNYIEENNLLSKTLHGFRPKLSTATALTRHR